ncbi:hypothetical protein [Henriciella sp.]|uniref:hypothetical protein n=1 Tax=Henriciella sp. TaxID=1968823 RepID=UPI0026116258|nr:hypothetical protein [Henriciella sp.]
MKDRMMKDERLYDLIAAYGAEPMAWPEDERDAAMVHLKAHPDRFAVALDEARALDLAFEREALPDVPAGLAERILEAAPAAHSALAGWAGRLREMVFPNGLRWPAGATAAALVMGVSAGIFSAPATADDGYQTAEEEVVYAALGYDGFEAYIQEVDE